jgi:transcriptional regulator with PAS, ATPase and Fis domain
LFKRGSPPASPSQGFSAENDLKTLEEVEKNYIRYSLDKLSHNYTQTAKSLGISLSTLKRKVKEYGLS